MTQPPLLQTQPPAPTRQPPHLRDSRRSYQTANTLYPANTFPHTAATFPHTAAAATYNAPNLHGQPPVQPHTYTTTHRNAHAPKRQTQTRGQGHKSSGSVRSAAYRFSSTTLDSSKAIGGPSARTESCRRKKARSLCSLRSLTLAALASLRSASLPVPRFARLRVASLRVAALRHLRRPVRQPPRPKERLVRQPPP